MYMGAKIALCLQTQEYRQKAPDVQHFLKCVQQFYIEAASQIWNRFPIGDPIIEMLQVLDPAVSRSKFPSMVPLAANIMSESKLQLLDNKWCKLSLVPLPFDSQDTEPEEFWGRLNKITDGVGAPQLDVLCTIICRICYVYTSCQC